MAAADWRGVVGVYLGLLVHATDQPNWLTPAIAHGLYDWLAFLVVARTYRREQLAAVRDDDDQPAEVSATGDEV